MPLKNATQFFLISAMAADPLLAAGLDAVTLGEGEADVDAGADADTDADAEEATELLLLLLLLLLLEQAASAAVRARPAAGTSRIRWAMDWIRMRAPLCAVRYRA